MLPSIAKLASKYGIAPLKKYGQNFIFWKAVLHLLLQHYTLATMHCTVTVTNGVGTIDTSSDGILDIKIKAI